MQIFKFVILILLFGLTLNIFAQKQPKIIENLDIVGNRRLTDEELLKSIETRAGGEFNEMQVQKDLQSLLALGVFNTTNTKVIIEEGVRGGINVIFQVDELPLVIELEFEGLRYVKKEEILAELRQNNVEIKIREPYKVEKTLKTKKVIEQFLRNRGYNETKVWINEEMFSAQTLKIIIVIDEMPNDDEDYDNNEK